MESTTYTEYAHLMLWEMVQYEYYYGEYEIDTNPDELENQTILRIGSSASTS